MRKNYVYPFMLFLAIGLNNCKNDIGPQINLKSTPTEKQCQYLRTPTDVRNCMEDFFAANPSLRSANANERSIDQILDLKNRQLLRSDENLSEFADYYYVVTFKADKGYAIVSKDKRSFPITAVLDSGAYSDHVLKEVQMYQHIKNMIAGTKKEIADYNKAVDSLDNHNRVREKSGSPHSNTENARQKMLDEGWEITATAAPRLATKWGQNITIKGVINERGLTYPEAYAIHDPDIAPTNPIYPIYPIAPIYPIDSSSHFRASAGDTDVFGCTPVAFGQVIYALRDFPGFKTLRYTNGEKVLWNKMDKNYSTKIENQRFLGWFTANCNPIYFQEGTMVFNITATKFLRKILGDYITSRYENCVIGKGNFHGYGWSEDKQVSADFFSHPHAFVIMTASNGIFSYIYHTFVIDGMIEFKKRIQGRGFLGTDLFRKWRNGIRHLYHINAGWRGASNGYYLYVQNVNDEFNYTGSNDAMDYRSKPAYLILWPNSDNK